MIALELQGRLGNQMFRYAYARVLMARRGDKDKLAIGLKWMSFKPASEGYIDQLCNFNTVAYTTHSEWLFKQYGSAVQRMVSRSLYYAIKAARRLLKKDKPWTENICFPILNALGLHYNHDNGHFFSTPRTKDVIIDGYWENPAYFSGGGIRNFFATTLHLVCPNLSITKNYTRR